MAKPLLKSPIRTVQPIDCAGIFPTKSRLAFMDVDKMLDVQGYFGIEKRIMFHDWKKHGMIFIEAKFEGARLSEGEKRGVENFVDLIYDGFRWRQEPQNIVAYFVVNHTVEDPTKSIFVANCPVVEWYLPKDYHFVDTETGETMDGGWDKPSADAPFIPFREYVWQTISMIVKANHWSDVTPRFYVHEDYLDEYMKSLENAKREGE